MPTKTLIVATEKHVQIVLFLLSLFKLFTIANAPGDFMAFNIPSAALSNAQANIESVQYIRAMAAIIVVVTHAFQWPLGEINYFLVKSGRFGVDIFFVISGFIITIIAGPEKFDPLKFLARRAKRIVPAYWIATILVTILAVLLPQSFRSTVPTVEGFIKSLIFIPSEDPKAPLLLLGWTLNYEAFFYFVFACTFWLRSEWRTIIQVFTLGTLVIAGQLLSEPGLLTGFYTSSSLIGFIMGLILGQAYRHSYIDRISKNGMVASIGVGILLTSAYYILPWNSPNSAPLHIHLVLSLLSALIVALLLAAERNGCLPSFPVIKFLGDASYSIYLFHLFPLGALWAIARRLFDVAPFSVYFPLAVACSIASIVFGIICYWLVERPFRSRRARAPAVLASA